MSYSSGVNSSFRFFLFLIFFFSVVLVFFFLVCLYKKLEEDCLLMFLTRQRHLSAKTEALQSNLKTNINLSLEKKNPGELIIVFLLEEIVLHYAAAFSIE